MDGIHRQSRLRLLQNRWDRNCMGPSKARDVHKIEGEFYGNIWGIRLAIFIKLRTLLYLPVVMFEEFLECHDSSDGQGEFRDEKSFNSQQSDTG